MVSRETKKKVNNPYRLIKNVSLETTQKIQKSMVSRETTQKNPLTLPVADEGGD